MRPIFVALIFTGIAAATLCGPARASSCTSVYCASLPSPEERIARASYLANRQDEPVSLPTNCAAVGDVRRTGCAVLQAVVADTQRAATYVDMAKGWTHDQRAAFARLLVAEEVFAKAVAENETDHLSAESGADAIAAQEAETAAFLNTLRTVVGGTTRLTFIEFPESDSALNAAYAQVMAVRDAANLAWGSVDTAGIRRTQRAWLAYRDAFVAFAAALDPKAAGAVKAELTTRRAVSLEGFLED